MTVTTNVLRYNSMGDILEFVKTRTDHEKEHLRPVFHFTPARGWMNDPNGLIFYRGWYHLFYQYNPKSCYWGSMHWGHAISRDMIHWKDLPIALYPDQPYDRHEEGGCFSGSAVEKDGKMFLFYTASTQVEGRTVQTQCLCVSEDGLHFEKYSGNPVILRAPEENSADFRDPKVLQVDDRWYMVVGGSVGGANAADGDGRVYLYKSRDLYSWEFVGNLLESNGKLGTMFECPDLFPLGEKWVLTCSPMNHPYYNKAMYCVGTIDFETARFRIEKTGNMDYGFDYYAPQSFLDEDGNRIVIAWNNEWQWMPWFEGWGPTDQENWKGGLSLPRKVSLDKDLNLVLEPVEQFWKITGSPRVFTEVKITAEKQKIELEDPYSYAVHMHMKLFDMAGRNLQIGMMAAEEKQVVMELDLVNMHLILDTAEAGSYRGGKIVTNLREKDGGVDLLFTVDHSYIEVYINGGEKCISCNAYPDRSQTDLWMRTMYGEATVKLLEIWKAEDVFHSVC